MADVETAAAPSASRRADRDREPSAFALGPAARSSSPRPTRAEDAVEEAVERWPSRRCSRRHLVSDDVVKTIQAIIARSTRS